MNSQDTTQNPLKTRIENFYTQESVHYTAKRYDGALQTYPQYIFRRRRSIVAEIIKSILPTFNRVDISIFDIGCADGSVIQYFDNFVDKKFAHIDAIDISEGMIAQAKSTISDSRYNFYLRGTENISRTYSIVTELGVYTPNIQEELSFMSNKLDTDGYIIYGVALRNSIEARIRRRREKNVEFLDTYLTFGQIKQACARTHLEIVSYTPYGIFIPKLWAFPKIAQHVQSCIDFCVKYIPFSTNLFHEVVFVLKKKV